MRSLFTKILSLLLLASGGTSLFASSGGLVGNFGWTLSTSKCPTSIFDVGGANANSSSSSSPCGGPGPGTLNVTVNSVTVNRGEQAIFDAVITGGTPPYTVSWTVNTGGGFVPANSVSGIIVNGAQLIVPAAVMDYLRAGEYRATAYDSATPVASGVAIGLLTVNAPTELTPVSSTLLGGTTLNLNAAPQMPGLPVLYELFQNGNLVASSATGSFSFAAANNLSEGSYQVRALYNNFSGSPYGGSPLSNIANVVVNVAPASVSLSGPAGSVTVGSSVTLTATAVTALNGDAANSYTFTGPNGFSETTSSNQITLTNIQLAQAGAYQVVASNAGGSTTPSAAYNLQVTPVGVTPAGVTLSRFPSDATVNAGSSVTFTASAAAGTNLTYSFFKVGSDTPIPSSGNTLTLSSVAESYQGAYFARATNVLGSAQSSNISLDVLTAPTSATLSASSSTVNFGAQVIFTANSVGGDPATGYRFYRNGEIVQEGPSNQLVINSANQATHGGVYHVVALNDAGSSLPSANFQLVVNPPPAGLSLVIDTPLDQQIGTSTQPEINWTLFNNGIPVSPAETAALAPEGSVFRLKITTSSACTTVTTPTFNGTLEMARRNFTLSESHLLNNTPYYVCVRLESADGLTGVTNWDTNHFTTRSAEIPLVTLRTEPSSSQIAPSGEPGFRVVAEAPESGSFVRLYEFDANGAVIGLVGEAALDVFGRAEFITSVSDIQEPDVVRLKARIHRDATEVGAFPTLSTDYHYNPNAGLTPPVISSACNGVIEWQTTGALHTYTVYRRLNKAAIPPDAAVGDYFNFGIAPYKKIATVPAANGATNVEFTDPEFASLTIGPEGLNYFVKASDGLRTSRISNPVNCFDTTNARNENHQIQVIEQGDGSTLSFYLIEQNNIAHASMDNDSHRKAYVQLVQSSGSCDSVVWDNDRDTNVFSFDALTQITDPSQGLRNAIPIGTASFATGASYCSIVCITDTSNDRSALQQRGDDISDFTSSLCFNSGRIALNPDFAGIDTLTALDNGTSMRVTWNPVAQEQSLEFIDYAVELVEIPSMNAVPNWEAQTKIATRINNINSNQAVITGLRSGAYYAARVEAIAVGFQPNQRSGGDVYLKAQTFNLSPQVLSAELSFPYGTMTKAVLTMLIRQTQPTTDISGLGTRDPLTVRFSGFSVRGGQAREVRMNDLEQRVVRGSQIVSGMQLPSETATMAVVLDTSELLNQYDRSGFDFKVEVENSIGMVTQYTARALPEKGLVAAGEGRGGCAPQSVSAHQQSPKALIILILSLAALLGLKRRRLLLQR